MDNLIFNQRRPLTIAHLVQQAPSGPKVNSLALLKAVHSRGHNISALYLQGNRQVSELKNIQPVPEQKALGISGYQPFKFVESTIRFSQNKLHLPYLGLFDSFRFKEACLNHLSHCDIFHERYQMMSFGGAWATKKLLRPLVLEVHADVMNTEISLHSKPLRRDQRYFAALETEYCFKQAAKIIVVSKAVGETLQANWQIPAHKIITVPNAADTELFRPIPVDSEIRTELGLSNEPIVIFTGSFKPWHGLNNLIEAFSRVVLEVPKAKLLLVGDGFVRTELEIQTREAGFRDKVIFTGDVLQQKVPALLNMADVAVAPYPKLSSELWFSPLKLYEYMAVAKAIVASNVGQIAEVLTDGYSGLLVEPGNIEALSESLIRLLKNKELRLNLGQNAYKEALAKHSWENRAKKLEQIYFSVLATCHRQPH